MELSSQRLQVGPWPMNCYLLRCTATGQLAIVDPGADPDIIMAAVGDSPVRWILLTHGHGDHTGALEAVREATGAPVAIHPADAEHFAIRADDLLVDNMDLELGHAHLRVNHLPGHTPGSISLKLNGQALVGDAIFPGGPGHTSSPEVLSQSLRSLQRTVFVWPDTTELHPGHGTFTTVGAEGSAFEDFLRRERPPDLHGDVAWS